jgi:glucosylceramidase
MIMGSPWSPPAWMKDSGALGYGRLIDSDAVYATYADYFVKYVQAYAALGIDIRAITLQNEPHHEPYSYPGMRMERAEQSRLVQWLGPKFQAASITTRIIAWDHNWDEFNYPIFLLHDQAANPYIDGSAFHCYAGIVSNQSLVHNVHPDKDIYFTECSGGGWQPNFGANLMWDMSNLLIGATRHWAKTVIKWNIALDQDGGPKIDGGCTNCRGVVTIDKFTGEMTKNAEYYALGHASRFVLPGASRIASSDASGAVENVAFLNASGSFAVLVLNAESSAQSVEMTWRGQRFVYDLPERSVVTFTWPDAYNPPVEVWMTTADQTRRLHRMVDINFTGGTPPGDLDGDGDVDLDDHEVFAHCLGGPQVASPPSNCADTAFSASDLDSDGDVDAGDFARFQPLLGDT